MIKMGVTMARKAVIFSTLMQFLALSTMTRPVYGKNHNFGDQMRKMQTFKASLVNRASAPAQAPSPNQEGQNSPSVYHVTAYGADPTGQEDSTDAILKAMAAALEGPTKGFLMEGIANLGGARIDLQGGNYRVSRPLHFPVAAVGNLMIHGGTLRASDNFPADGYLIDLSPPSSPQSINATSSSTNDIDSELSSVSSPYNYEYITLKDLMLDSNFRGGAISVINSLRISIDNCYVSHFATTGIQVRQGHETYIRNSFLGQHITAGGDHGERNFSGTAIDLAGNDNAVTDVVIFSAETGIVVSGQANALTGVHCYNKATGFGGTGIYLKLPGLTQTRIVNCYMDFTGIVAEDPVQLLISNSFFLGDAYITLKSVNGVADGVTIVDNMFSGSGKGIDILKLDGPFKMIEQVVVDRNNVKGMRMKATVAKATGEVNGTSWSVDFNGVLLFPDLIRHVQYSLISANGTGFPSHALRSSSGNRVVVESDVAVAGRVFVAVNQGGDS